VHEMREYNVHEMREYSVYSMREYIVCITYASIVSARQLLTACLDIECICRVFSCQCECMWICVVFGCECI